MLGPIILIATIILFPFILIMWNKARCKGKVVGVIARGDIWVQTVLCELMDDYIVFNGRGYEMHPKLARLTAFPGGWPKALQETLPTFLLREDDAIPLDWINLGERRVSSTEIGTSLDPNIYRILVKEGARVADGDSKGFSFNWKKALPFILIAVGILGFVALQYFKNSGGA